jgi:hypothetical protein
MDEVQNPINSVWNFILINHEKFNPDRYNFGNLQIIFIGPTHLRKHENGDEV